MQPSTRSCSGEPGGVGRPQRAMMGLMPTLVCFHAHPDDEAIATGGLMARAAADGHRVVLVSSGAVSAGVAALGLARRPVDTITLQALSALGQPRLMQVYDAALRTHGLVAGQVLLTPYDFVMRRQYLHARQTIGRLLELGCVPIINENDTIADDEIRFSDNDRIAALVSHSLRAEVLQPEPEDVPAA